MLNSSRKISELQTKITKLETQVETAAETHANELATRDGITEELTTAHAAAILAKETEIANLKGDLANSKASIENLDVCFETRVNAEVVRRCADAGLNVPIKRDPEINAENDLEEIREKIAASTDPKERAELARKARELRTKRA
jgi:hypothetical protein